VPSVNGTEYQKDEDLNPNVLFTDESKAVEEKPSEEVENEDEKLLPRES